MRLSVVIPIYDMPNCGFFFERCLKSLEMQSFQDFETIITKDGKMAENTNSAIKRATGDLIKILYMDDYLTHKDSLQVIVDAFKGQWLVTACDDDLYGTPHLPSWNDKMIEGFNTIGSPSVVTIKNQEPLLFDEKLGWLLDSDYYKRMYDKFGEPVYLNDINVTIGIHDGQATNLMGDEIKIKEHKYLKEKYAN